MISPSANEEIRVQVKEFKKRKWLDVRVYASLKSGEEKTPTGKGVLIPASSYTEFKKAVLLAEELLRDTGSNL
jgi:hypothetical protein